MPATGRNKSYRLQSLSIRLHADGFSFFVCDPQTSTLIRGEHFVLNPGETLPGRLLAELERQEYYNNLIDQVFVLVCSPATRVPLEEFRRDEAETLYHFTIGDGEEAASSGQKAAQRCKVIYTILPQLESVELYSIPTDVEEVILQHYPTARFFGAYAMLQERLLRYDTDNAETDTHTLYVCLDSMTMSTFAFSDGHLWVANNFGTKNTSLSNTLYLLLNLWKNMKLDAEHDEMVLIAHTDYDAGTLKTSLEDYIRTVRLLAPKDLFAGAPLAAEKEVPLDLMALLLNRI